MAITLTSTRPGTYQQRGITLTYPTQKNSSSSSSKEKNKGGFFGGVGYFFEKAALSVLGTIEGIWDIGVGTIADMFGADDWADQQFANDWVDYNHADEWYNPGKGWKIAGDMTDIVPYAAEKILLGATSTIEGVHDYIAGGIASAVGADDTAKRIFDDDLGDYGYADRKHNVTGGWRKTVGDVAGGIGSSLPSIAANFIPGVGPFVGIAISAVGAAGNATKEAYRQTGELSWKEYGYGAMVGATEGVIEGVSNKFGVGAKGIANALKGGAKSLAKETAGTITKKAIIKGVFKEMGKQALSEGLEEGIAEFLAPQYAKITYDPNAKNATVQEIGYAALVGAMSGALMSGGSITVNNVQRYQFANTVINEGRADTVLEKSRYFAERETQNDTGLEVYKNIKDKYDALQKSLAETGGKYVRMEQKLALGELNSMNTTALMAPFVVRDAQVIVLTAKMQAERFNALGLKDASGNNITITAEDLTEGIDLSLAKSKPKAFTKQVGKALSSNSTLATLAAMETTGRLMMDAKVFESVARQGRDLITPESFHKYVETATPEQKAAFGAEVGITDWNSTSYEKFQNVMAEYTTSAKFDSQIKQQKRANKLKNISIENSVDIPKELPSNMVDGAYRFGESLGVLKEGENYYIYFYKNRRLSFAQSRTDINKLLADIHELAAQEQASEAARNAVADNADANAYKSMQTQSAVPQLAKPQVTLPQTTAPKIAVPQTTTPQATAPQATVPRVDTAQVVKPQSNTPQAVASQVVAPQATISPTIDTTIRSNIPSEVRTAANMQQNVSQTQKAVPQMQQKGMQMHANNAGASISMQMDTNVSSVTEGKDFALPAIDSKKEKSYNKRKHVSVSKQEYAVINSAIMKRNSAIAAKGQKLPAIGTVYSSEYFYVYKNYDIGEFGVLKRYKLTDNNKTKIAETEKKYANSSGREVGGYNDTQRGIVGNGESGNADFGWRRADGRDDTVHQGQPESDRRYALGKGTGDRRGERGRVTVGQTASNGTQSRIDSINPEKIHEYLRENVKGYKELSVPNQVMVRAIIRQGRALGIPDADLLLYAKVATRSGVNVVFDKEATYLGKNKDTGEDVYADGFYERGKNQITVNPEGSRSAERLLIHELAHAIFKTTDGAIIAVRGVKNLTQDEKDRITQSYAKLHKTSAESETSIKIIDEQNAHYAEGMLSDRAILERLLADKPTLKDKILNFFKKAESDYADTPKLNSEAKKLYRQYKKLFDEFSAQNADSNAVERTVAVRENDKKYAYSNATTNQKIVSMANEVENGSFDPKSRVELGIVPDDLAQTIKDLTGVDANGYKVVLEARQVDHILKDHGKSGKTDRSMSDYSDIGKIEYVINNFDDISKGKSTQAYKNVVDGKTQGAQTVLYEKDIGEKSYYVVQAVPDTKAKTLFVVSAFIGKKGYKNKVSQFTNAQSLGATSEIGTANTSNNSIPQNAKKSTQKSKNVDGKDYALPRDFDWDSLEEIFAEVDDTNSEMFDADAVILKGAPTENLTAPKGIKQVVANFSNERVYGKGVMMSVINKLPDMRGMSLKSREEFASVLHEAYKQLDTAEQRQTFAHDLAQYMVARELREIMVDNPQIDTEILENRIAKLKTGVGKLTFSKSDIAEIRHNRDLSGMRSVLGRWNRKKQLGYTYTMDQFVTDFARETPGMEYLEDMHPVDAFLEIDDMYTKAKAELGDKLVSIYEVTPDAEINAMVKHMEESLLKSFENEGEGLRYFADHFADKMAYWQLSYKELEGRAELINAIDYEMQQIKDLKEKTYLNASEYADGIFDKSIGVLASIKFKGNINPKLVRGAARDLLQWYNKDNHLLEYVDDRNTGYYIEDIHEGLERLAKGKDKLSKTDLRDLHNALSHFRSIMNQYNKVFVNGKYVDAMPLVKGFVNVADANSTLGVGALNNPKLWYEKNFGDPLSVMKFVDQYQEDGFNTFIFKTLQRAGLDAQIAEMKALSDYQAFMDKHKGYEKVLETLIEYRGRKMTKAQLMGLYMTSKREQAQAGLIINGYTYVGDKGQSIRVPGWASDQNISQSEIKQKIADAQKEMEALLTEDDKGYIKVVEAGFEAAKQMKIDRDMQKYGYTNAIEGYYYPIRRANTAKSIDMSMQSEIDRVSSASFNKDTVQGAKQELFIGGVDTVFLRHIHAVSQYAHLSSAIDTYNKLFNLDVSGNKNKAVSVKTQTKEAWNYKGEKNKTGAHLGDEYFRKLIEDIQGIRAYDEAGSLIAKMRGNYATFALGANPKVWFTQGSSLFAATSIIDYDSIVAGFKLSAHDVDIYCDLAQLRNTDNSAAKAQGVVNRLNKTADFLMKPIGAVDRIVVKRLFAACQIQVEKNGGGKIGTDANKIAAGELLERVILETQQNALATERSGAMRSSSEFAKAITMFSADAMKVTGRVIDAYGEMNAIDRRIKLLQKAQKGGATYLDETVLGKAIEKQDGSADKKISAGMTDAERYEVLKDRYIENIPTAEELSEDIVKTVPEINSWADLDKHFGNKKRTLIHKIASEFGVFTHGEYKNADVDLSFEFSNNNFRETYSKQGKNYAQFAKLFSVFNDVIDSAVGIEVHNRNTKGYKPDPTLKNVYVLMSAFEDGDNVVPVKLEVKEFSDKKNSLYVAITLEGIKKAEVWKSGSSVEDVAHSSRSANISISRLFEKINPSDESFYKYIPEQFKNGKKTEPYRRTVAEEIESLQNQKKAASKKLGRAVGAMATSALYMAIIAKVFRWLYHKDREKDKEEKTRDVVVDFVGNLFGGLPLFKEVYARFYEGYEIDNPTYSMINDVLNSAAGVMEYAKKSASGEATKQDGARLVRNLFYAGGQASGIPTRNVYNLVYGAVGFNEKAAYKWDNVFYKKNYRNDLYKYIDDDNDEMVAFTMDLVLKDSIGGGVNDSVKSELVELIEDGRSVLPRNISSTITYQGQEYQLSDGQLAAVRSEYAKQVNKLDKLFSKSHYKSLSSEDKERAIKYAYDIYYEEALSSALGIETSNSTLVAKAIGEENMALFAVATRGLESDKDPSGKTVAGSKRRKVLLAINSLGLTREKKLLLICAKGYGIQDGDIRGLSAANAKRVLLKYILSLKISKDEKARLATMCGFEVNENGRIVAKSAFSA
ncbi:MAG: hypothetical protein E7667_03515 [Ruminococcaceae bacterium]|nr:hypothetical protein [Oscillospiraceae bacterium]